MKRYYFIAGLYRSGSNLLSSLLSQNPLFHTGPISSVMGIMENLEEHIKNDEYYLASPEPRRAHSVISSIIHSYYSDVDKPVVFDKNRAWTSHVNYIENYIKQPAKILCPVRSVDEIVTSFLTLIHKNESKTKFCSLDRRIISCNEELNDLNRCRFILNENFNNNYNSLKFAFDNNLQDRLLLIEYNDLVLNPNETMERVYDFLGEEYFEHDFQNIVNNNVVDDKDYYNMPGLHDVRTTLSIESKDPKDILPKEIIDRCRGMEFWRN